MPTNKPVAARPAKESSELRAALSQVAVQTRRILKVEENVEHQGNIIENQRRELTSLKCENSKLTKEVAKSQSALALLSKQLLGIKRILPTLRRPPPGEDQRRYPKREASEKL